jgi:pimeloyl-ACP methyl ester carboxylesterase
MGIIYHTVYAWPL